MLENIFFFDQTSNGQIHCFYFIYFVFIIDFTPVLRVSVRRQTACYVTERRTGGNTTDEFNSHTVNTV